MISFSFLCYNFCSVLFDEKFSYIVSIATDILNETAILIAIYVKIRLVRDRMKIFYFLRKMERFAKKKDDA